MKSRWLILFGSFIAYTFDALEISILSFAIPAIMKDLDITKPQAGLLATATLIGMGVSGFVTGWIADNLGRKRALVFSLAAFAALTVAVAFAPNYLVLMALRFLSGIGLGGVWGILSAYVVETWPAESRGKAAAFVLSAFPIGGALAALISGRVLPDWRLLFLVAGLAAVLPLLLVLFTFPESEEWRRSREENPENVSVAEVFRPPLRRTTVLASLVATLAFVAYYGASTWLPSYLTTDRHLSASTVGRFMTILNLGMFLGYFAFGWIADRFGRKTAIIISLTGAGVLMPLYGIVTDQTMLLWLGPAYAFFMTFSGLFGSYLGELYPTRVRTTGAGVCFNIGRGISAFAPFVIGGLAAATSLGFALAVSGVGFLMAGVVMLALPRTGQAPQSAVPAQGSVKVS